MKNLIYIMAVCFLVYNCKSSHSTKTSHEYVVQNQVDNDTVRIANDDVAYEIIIIEPGFNTWLQSVAKPEGFYSKAFLESRNIQYVTAWNNRVMQPSRYSPNLYEMQINYNQNIDYGYEVNYKLYNYFIYFQLTYKQQLTGFVPRI
ncbi:DUF6146 family protein [Corallibacter sp.]|uniref:DUF6146 family protein n=1 Tax=Corallibacter sp. TaxID=2038084 RepID=UPI003AB7960B